MPYAKVIGLLALLVMVVSPVAGQSPEDWSAYVYNQATQTLVRVYEDGTTVEHPLELGNAVALQGRHMAFWADGETVAFCAVRYGAVTESTLIVRDLAADENRFEVPFPDSSDCRVTPASLNEDDGLLAVSLFNRFPADTTVGDDLPPWQIAIIDTTSGDVLHTLDSNTALVKDAGIDPQEAIIAEAQRMSGDGLTFYALPYAVGGLPAYDTYHWDFATGTLTADTEQAVYDVATLPETGEQAYATQDETRPFAIPNGPVPANNVVMYDSGDGEAIPIYHIPNWVIVDVAFIENGQRLAISLIPSADEPQPSAFAVNVRLVTLDRNGQTSDLTSTDGYLSVAGAPGGAVVLMGPSDPTGITRLMLSMGGQLRPVWEASGEPWELAWAAPTMAQPDLPPFAPLKGLVVYVAGQQG
jgi:hypothetical protein